jgi:CubicO group peptidase (beta-lactamase class C family)
MRKKSFGSGLVPKRRLAGAWIEEEGDEKAFCCFYASARDFARLGKLFMTDGKFGEDQVVPAWYIQEMIKLPAMLTEEGTPNQRYGLHVWVYDDGQSPMIYLRGIKGQYVFVLPEEDLLVVRVGEMRLPDVQMPQNKMLGKKTRVDYEQKAGHAGEIFEYIKIARNIVKKK